MLEVVVLDNSTTKVTVSCTWADTIGRIREKLNQELLADSQINECELFCGSILQESCVIGKGVPDNCLVASAFFDAIQTLKSHGDPLDQVSLYMRTPKQFCFRRRRGCLLFPGQGTQKLGMATDLLTGSGSHKALELFSIASSILGFDLLHVCQYGPQEHLDSTRISQLAVMVTSLAAVAKAQHETPARFESIDVVAGFSVGEFSALVHSGTLTFEEGVRLVNTRALAMQKAAEIRPGTMVSVVGLDDDTLESLCQEARAINSDFVITVANRLFPNGRVVSGDTQLCDHVLAHAKEKGATLARQVAVTGAFHSPLMSPAREELMIALEKTSLTLSTTTVVFSNVTAQPYRSEEEIRRLLAEQLCAPVLWEDVLRNVIELGVMQFVEAGPGRQLKAMVKRLDPSLEERVETLM